MDQENPNFQQDHAEFERQIQEWQDSSLLDGRMEEIASEMQSLAAIYPNSCKLIIPPTEVSEQYSLPRPGQRIRYELHLDCFTLDEWEGMWPEENMSSKHCGEIPLLHILVSLSSDYPEFVPPQLQLAGKYIGNYAIDPALFGEVTKIFLSRLGPTYTPGSVCVFDGIEHALTRTKEWYRRQAKEGADGEQAREIERIKRLEATTTDAASDSTAQLSRPDPRNAEVHSDVPAPLSSSVSIYSSEPITASRSVFIGHAVAVTDPTIVASCLRHLMEDKSRRLSKASHPLIYAYRIVKAADAGRDPVILADNDDDGETAAGGRLAHLLQILQLENVLVIVSRWYGGTLLGAERFKLINQAAKDALELGGFLEEGNKKKRR